MPVNNTFSNIISLPRFEQVISLCLEASSATVDLHTYKLLIQIAVSPNALYIQWLLRTYRQSRHKMGAGHCADLKCEALIIDMHYMNHIASSSSSWREQSDTNGV